MQYAWVMEKRLGGVMDKQRIQDILRRLEDLADNLEKEAMYYRKSIKKIKDELKEEGFL